MSHAPYPKFATTDTLAQLVTKLESLTSVVDTDILTLENKDSDFGAVFDISSGDFNFGNNTSVNANNGRYTFDSDFTLSSNVGTLNNKHGLFINAGDRTLTTKYDFSVVATKTISLQGMNDTKNVELLGSSRESFATFKMNDKKDLTIQSSTENMIVFNSSNKTSTFGGDIVLPSVGAAAPLTNSKTVAGAINELRTAILALGGNL
jgi:hypothetical protein